MALFAGGCVVTLAASGALGALVLLPLAGLILNGAVLGALWGHMPVSKPAFYFLAAVDFVVALGVGFLFAEGAPDSQTSLLGLALFGFFALKGGLTVWYARNA
jgi:hypothetical protein